MEKAENSDTSHSTEMDATLSQTLSESDHSDPLFDDNRSVMSDIYSVASRNAKNNEVRKCLKLIHKLKNDNVILEEALKKSNSVDIASLRAKLRSNNADIVTLRQLNSELKDRIQVLEEKLLESFSSVHKRNETTIERPSDKIEFLGNTAPSSAVLSSKYSTGLTTAPKTQNAHSIVAYANYNHSTTLSEKSTIPVRKQSFDVSDLDQWKTSRKVNVDGRGTLEKQSATSATTTSTIATASSSSSSLNSPLPPTYIKPPLPYLIGIRNSPTKPLNRVNTSTNSNIRRLPINNQQTHSSLNTTSTTTATTQSALTKVLQSKVNHLSRLVLSYENRIEGMQNEMDRLRRASTLEFESSHQQQRNTTVINKNASNILSGKQENNNRNKNIIALENNDLNRKQQYIADNKQSPQSSKISRSESPSVHVSEMVKIFEHTSDTASPSGSYIANEQISSKTSLKPLTQHQQDQKTIQQLAVEVKRLVALIPANKLDTDYTDSVDEGDNVQTYNTSDTLNKRQNSMVSKQELHTANMHTTAISNSNSSNSTANSTIVATEQRFTIIHIFISFFVGVVVILVCTLFN